MRTATSTTARSSLTASVAYDNARATYRVPAASTTSLSPRSASLARPNHAPGQAPVAPVRTASITMDLSALSSLDAYSSAVPSSRTAARTTSLSCPSAPLAYDSASRALKISCWFEANAPSNAARSASDAFGSALSGLGLDRRAAMLRIALPSESRSRALDAAMAAPKKRAAGVLRAPTFSASSRLYRARSIEGRLVSPSTRRSDRPGSLATKRALLQTASSRRTERVAARKCGVRRSRSA
mmetsp:Transcript_2346/g.7074  ORF Transcript_2346/g.7074 Transcript_2346/m.7074 type:complete len:241 (+) Transcript_2346:679-1401(+)